MMRHSFRAFPCPRALLGILAVLVYATPASAIFGARRRTAVVAYSMGEANARAQQEAAAQQQAAAAQQQAAADQAAAAAAQTSAAASQHAATAPRKTTEQKLEELQSLYKQGLISESDYNAAKAKILADM